MESLVMESLLEAVKLEISLKGSKEASEDPEAMWRIPVADIGPVEAVGWNRLELGTLSQRRTIPCLVKTWILYPKI